MPCMQEKLVVIRRPDDSTLPPDPEDRVTKTMELTEDLLRTVSPFLLPKSHESVPSNIVTVFFILSELLLKGVSHDR